MRCAWVQDRLLLYLAGEMEAEEAARLQKHLETCETCKAQREMLTDLLDRTEAALDLSLEAPPTLEGRVMDSVRQLPVRHPFDWRFLFPNSRHRTAMVGVGLILLGFWAGTLLKDHPIAEGTLATVDVPALGRLHHLGAQAPEFGPEDLARDLTSQVHFPVLAVDLRPEGAQLLGGRRSNVHGVPVAQLQYQWNGPGGQHARVSLFQVDARKLTLPASQRLVYESESYQVGKGSGQVYVMWKSERASVNNVMIGETIPMHLLFQLACHTCEKQERL